MRVRGVIQFQSSKPPASPKTLMAQARVHSAEPVRPGSHASSQNPGRINFNNTQKAHGRRYGRSVNQQHRFQPQGDWHPRDTRNPAVRG